MIDAAGRLVGINTAIVSRTGGSIGIGFAIPSDMALNVVTNLIESGEVPRGLLGLLPVNLTPDLADAFNLPSTRGALVNQVQLGSPADKAGIKHGDIIMQVDDVEIESAPQLRLVVSQMRPGRKVAIELIREGKSLHLPVVLGSLTGSLVSSAAEQEILEGVLLESIDQSSREALSIPDEVEGVLVSDLLPGSPYAALMSVGMVVLEVNGQAVTSPAELNQQLQQGVNRLYIWSSGSKQFMVIRL